MDSKEMIKMWSLRTVLITLVLSFFSVQSSFASYEASDIKLDGIWGNGKRSIIQTIPINAYTDGHNLYIQNTIPDRDITITISNYTTGQIVYKQTTLAASTTYIVISIEELSVCEYKLELNTLYEDYLQGNFTKQ